MASTFHSGFEDYYNKALSVEIFTSSERNSYLRSIVPEKLMCQGRTMLSSKLTLRKVRCRLLSDPLNEDCENEIHTFCADVIKNNASSAEDRAWAYYYLGLIKLHHAKRTGILRKRWQGSVEGKKA